METLKKILSLSLFASLLSAGACATDGLDEELEGEGAELKTPRGPRGPIPRPEIGRPLYAPSVDVPVDPVCVSVPTEIGHGNPVVDVASAGDFVYAAEVDVSGEKGWIVRYPREGGAREELAEAIPMQLAATTDEVYWLQRRTADVRMLQAVGTDGGDKRFLAYTSAESFVVDGGFVYLLGRSTLERFDLATGEHIRTAIGALGAYPTTLAVDDTHLWFMARYAPDVDAFYRVDKARGEIEPVAKVPVMMTAPSVLAVNADRVVAVVQGSREKAVPVSLDKASLAVSYLPSSPWLATGALLSHHRLFVIEEAGDADLWSMDTLTPATADLRAKLPGTARGLTADPDCAYFGLNEGATGYILSIAL